MRQVLLVQVPSGKIIILKRKKKKSSAIKGHHSELTGAISHRPFLSCGRNLDNLIIFS